MDNLRTSVQKMSADAHAKTDQLGHRTNNTPELNVRKWFQSLASGADRCMAIAVTDQIFNETFISLTISGLVHGDNNNKSKNRHDRRADFSGLMRSVTLEDIIQRYRHLEQGLNSYQAAPENTALRIEKLTAESSLSMKNVAVSAGINDHNEASSGCETITFSTKHPADSVKKPDSTSAILQLKSDLRSSIRPNNFHLGEKSSLQPSADSQNTNSVTKDMMTKVDDKLKVSLSKSAHTATQEKGRKTHGLVDESKTSPSTASSRLTDETIIEQIRIVFSTALNFMTDKNLEQSYSSPKIARITIDPTFLDIKDGDRSRFLYHVDKWIQSIVDQRHGPEKNDVIYFLSEEDLSPSHWPNWLGQCADPGQTSVKLALLLLARMEMSIRQAHRRYLYQADPTVSDRLLVETCKSHQVTKVQRGYPPMDDTDKNILVSLEPLASSSNSEDESYHDNFKKLLHFQSLCQVKKTYSNILADAQTYGVLHVGLSPFKLKDILLVPFQLVSEYAISCCVDLGDQYNAQSFIRDLTKKWNSIFMKGITSGAFNRSVGDNHVNPISNHGSESVDACHDDRYMDDEASHAHDDPKGKRKKKKKKKKKTNNHIVNYKNVSEVNEGIPTDHSKHPSLETKESLTAPVGLASKASQLDTNTSSTQRATNVRTDITVSKISGSNSTCVVGLGRVDVGEDKDDDVWETVEHKGGRERAKSKKDSPTTQTVTGSGTNVVFNELSTTSSPSSPSGRVKSGRGRKKNSRRNSSKQITNEMLNSLIQSTGEEVNVNSRKDTNTDIDRKSLALANEISTGAYRVVKTNSVIYPDQETKSTGRINTAASSLSSSTFADIARLSLKTIEDTLPKDRGAGRLSQQDIFRPATGRESDKSKMQKCATASFADHNTAQTCPETVSGVSGMSCSTSTPNVKSFNQLEEGKVRGSATILSGDKNDSPATYNTVRDASYDSMDDGEPVNSDSCTGNDEVPPLQTLLGPGVTNSATSSVASSLEVPHAIRRKWNSNPNNCREDDVGYHLLKVCERLSDEMNTFMVRRASALTHRRRERAALLAALQDIAQNIWGGSSCHVEMYGSCATQLDLPSSDLDVVVCGLDVDSDYGSILTRIGLKSYKSRQSRTGHTEDEPDSNLSKDTFTKNVHQSYPSLSSSGMRVLRLAADVERQPWAVQVKAIPTASVPVVKVLADPSRLSGVVPLDGEWLRHSQNITSASAVAAGGMIPRHQQLYEHSNFISGNEFFPSSNPPNGLQKVYQNAQPPWRGADVMNGLISVDITFEGPEHGGIGSTTFSARVVQEACNETGLPPDRAPAVQLIMVLKEMLAQRRLNEPFSGGLSSYAILLLAVAVIKERRAIREELERVERQRKAVAMESSGRQFCRNGRNIAVHPLYSNLDVDEKKTDDSSEEVDRHILSSIVKNSASAQVHGETESADLSTPRDYNGKHDQESVRSPLFPQGSNDVLEVLCSGEATAGKLLMHFLLFYGHHFDAHTTCIDVLGTHHPDYSKVHGFDNSAGPTYLHSHHLSPFLQRKAGGLYDPVTGIYTVDHIVVYDPLEGAESNNVARSCFAWSTIRWVFEQCYNTLSGLVERDNNPVNGQCNMNEVDDMPHLLELLLSF